MKSRVLNSNHKHYDTYSKLGIYQPWIDSFQEFYNHIGKRPSKKHSIDRINNFLGYFPGNVRWVKQAIQTRNKGNNVKIEFQGKVWLLCDLAKDKKVPQKLVRTRLNQGMNIEDALYPYNYRTNKRVRKYRDQVRPKYVI